MVFIIEAKTIWTSSEGLPNMRHAIHMCIQ